MQLKKDCWEESRWLKSFSQSPHSQGHSHHPRLTELQDLHLDLQLQSKPHPGYRFYPARQHGNTVGVLHYNALPDYPFWQPISTAMYFQDRVPFHQQMSTMYFLPHKLRSTRLQFLGLGTQLGILENQSISSLSLQRIPFLLISTTKFIICKYKVPPDTEDGREGALP